MANSSARTQAELKQALTLQKDGQLAAAKERYRAILSREPGHFDALLFSALLALQLGETDEALRWIDRALTRRADHALARLTRGLIHKQRGEWDAALQDYERAIALQPGYAEAWFDRGNVLRELRRFDEALASYDAALTARPQYADALMNRGTVLRDLGRPEQALIAYQQALALRPNAITHANSAHVLYDLQRYDEALIAYRAALALDPASPLLLGECRKTQMQLCDWQNFDADLAEIAARIERGQAAFDPFAFLALSGSPSLQRILAQSWVRDYVPASPLPFVPRASPPGKLRIGYFSADFRNHPISVLIAELIELHDRERFEVIGISIGPDSHDAMRERLERGFDRFIDARSWPDQQLIQHARELELDIAVDLGGFTTGSRPTLFAQRVAPVQLSYLGYPGTSGAPYIDYLLADRIIVPASHEDHFTEKLIRLPSYQVNDSTRTVGDKRFTREEFGLPSEGFVFCCFNGFHKLTPGTFARWMRILARAPGAVLWLYVPQPSAVANLQREAERHGIDRARLIFAGRLPYEDYLARYRVADLFLDTLPYNAGTTASDALWAGLPVLTLPGETFASRMAASLLTAVRLPELIAATERDYEEIAVALASDPSSLSALKLRLSHPAELPLFDTRRFARSFESALIQINQRARDGLAPQHVWVEH